MSNNFFLADRVKELSRVEGRVDITLDGAVDGFSSFGDFYASGDTVFYAITDNVKYEVGSGSYVPAGATNRSLTRNVLRSSDVNSGPYFLYGSGAGSHAGTEGYFYPMWLTRSAALSGVGNADGPYPNVHEHVFSGHPGVTFYMPGTHMVHGLSHSVANKASAAASGSDYALASRPVDFSAGTKEVFVTYPGARSVFNAYGTSGVNEPKESGLAIWKNSSVVSYSSDLLWDDDNSRLAIKKDDPSYAIDVGGLRSFSQVRASGFIDGGSGVWFSGVAGQFSGGRQLEPFLRNEVGATANGIVKLSGTVDEFIGFENQAPTLVFAGPASDCGCDDAVPTFRALTAGDFPLTGADGLDTRYVQQNNDGISTGSEYPYSAGMVAIYKASGQITYDSGIMYNATANRLGLGGDSVGTIVPAHTLDVSGNMAANSGYFDQLLFTNNIIKIGENTGNDKNNLVENFYTVNIGDSAGVGSSGNSYTIFMGHEAGRNTHRASGSVVIGAKAGQGSVSGIDSVIIGNHAASGASGVFDSVVIGKFAGQDTTLVDNIVAIGQYAASGLENSSEDNVALGYYTLSNTVLSTGVNAIGFKAASNSSGVYRTVSIGHEASKRLHGADSVVSIGRENLNFASGIQDVESIGTETLLRASGAIRRTTAIGKQAGYEARNVFDTVFIGYAAGQAASGSHNTYIGRNAGIGVSGHNNIEIVTSGGSSSILTHSASNRLNIANTIVGTINSSNTPSTLGGQISNIGVGIGYMQDATPPATLFVRPSGREDHPFIVRHQGSGGKAPYVALQSGDATTFFHITNSGNVVTSGFMNPSGGILLEAITPGDWMDSTTSRLYNDAGTLKWNGSALSLGAGSMSHWHLRSQIDDTADSGVKVENNQTVFFSGIKGIHTQIESGNRRIIVDPTPLSGYLDGRIDGIVAGSYNWKHANIGPSRAGGPGGQVTQDGAGKYDFTRTQLIDVPDEGAIGFSGVNGITIDLTTLTGGGYTSGIYEIGWDASSSYGWNVLASGETAGGGRNTINSVPDSTGVAFSGIKGIQFALTEDTTNNVKVLTSDPSVLSGVLYDTTISSGNYIWEDHLTWRASGIAVSGLAVSNYNAIQGITSKSATSGIKIQNDKYVLDSGNGGQLSFLVLQDINPFATTAGLQASSGNILISDQSGVLQVPRRGSNKNTTAIGSRVGENASGHYNSVMVGLLAGGNSRGNTTAQGNSIFIGEKAGHRLDSTAKSFDSFIPLTDSELGENVLIGRYAGDAASGVGGSVGIGPKSLHNATRQMYPVSIGYGASQRSFNSVKDVTIGFEAMQDSYSTTEGVFIGEGAGKGIQSSLYPVSVGSEASAGASGLQGSVGVGYQALKEASGTLSQAAAFVVGVGYRAGNGSNDVINSTFIGRDAAYLASGSKNSVFIGNNAGQLTSHANSIILSNKGMGVGGTEVYPIDWINGEENFILDIAHGIQGKVKTGPHSTIAGESNTYFTTSTGGSVTHDVRLHIGPCVRRDDKDLAYKLADKTLEIQPTDESHAVLTLDQPNHWLERVTRNTAGGPLLQTNTDVFLNYPAAYNNVAGQKQRDSYAEGPRDSTLDVINRHGFPVIPIFAHYDDTTGELNTGDSVDVMASSTSEAPGTTTSIIPRYLGAYAIGYADINGNGADWYMAICVREQSNVSTDNTIDNSSGLKWRFVKLKDSASA